MTRAQEREERRRMGRGVTTSIVALFLCWVPVLGILLAAVGFIGVMRTVTEYYRKRFIVSLIAVILILVICAGVLTAEVYAYSRDPDILSNFGTRLLEMITGEYMDDYNYYGGMDYSDSAAPGLGMNSDLYYTPGGAVPY
jgi:type III secretory pathway component EscS